MLVFIRLLPMSVTQHDLRKFLGKALRPSWRNLFFTRGTVRSTEIRKFSNHANDSVEYHGIVEIEPAKGAVRAIRKLNRTRLKDREVEVRKYYQRSALRDRRSGEMDYIGEDRRKRDRRRWDMESEHVPISRRLEPGRNR